MERGKAQGKRKISRKGDSQHQIWGKRGKGRKMSGNRHTRMMKRIDSNRGEKEMSKAESIIVEFRLK